MCMPFFFPAFSPARSISNREVVDDKRKAAERDREKEGGGTCDSQTPKKKENKGKEEKKPWPVNSTTYVHIGRGGSTVLAAKRNIALNIVDRKRRLS